MWTTFWFHILRGQHKELYFDLKTLTDRLEEIIPKILPIIVFFYIPNDLPVPKIASYYSQCMTTCIGAALKSSAISTS